jgi:uncharacterized protein
MSGAVAHRLPDGRLHLQHGPIDLICEAWGQRHSVEAGYRRAGKRFGGLLEELVEELPALRSENKALIGSIAKVMGSAVAPFHPLFITPMAAVAGAVAEAVLTALVGPGISRAYVNNGGDIALHLASGESLVCAIAGLESQITVQSHDRVRGIATSGWRGRSWSLGIADAVSVLAKTAAMADAAATMIANAVDLPGHPEITRRPAQDMQSDSDLGARLVTVGVGRLTLADVNTALARGAAAAQAYRANGLIETAALFLQGESRIVGPLALKEAAFA